jgi:hypothetical protein
VLPGLDLGYNASTIYLLVITPLVGAAIYGAFFVTAGGLQFFLIDGAEFTAAFVYGGAYAGQLPGSVLITPIPHSVHLRLSSDASRVPSLAVDHGTSRADVSPRLARLVRARLRSLGLAAGMASVACWCPQVHRCRRMR